MLSWGNLVFKYLKSATTCGMSLFFLGIAIAGLEKPDNSFLRIPKIHSLFISLSIFAFISSFAENGLMKNSPIRG